MKMNDKREIRGKKWLRVEELKELWNWNNEDLISHIYTCEINTDKYKNKIESLIEKIPTKVVNMTISPTAYKTKGSWLFREGDIDWSGFLSKLVSAKNTGQSSLGKRLWTQFPPPIQTLVEQSPSDISIQDENKSHNINILNEILNRVDFYQEQDFSGLLLSDEVQGLLSRERERLSLSDVQRLNRLLIETAYPHDIAKSPTEAYKTKKKLEFINDLDTRIREDEAKTYLWLIPYYRLNTKPGEHFRFMKIEEAFIIEGLIEDLLFSIEDVENFAQEHNLEFSMMKADELLDVKTRRGLRNLKEQVEKIPWIIKASVKLALFCSESEKPVIRAAFNEEFDNEVREKRFVDLTDILLGKIWESIPTKLRQRSGRPRK